MFALWLFLFLEDRLPPLAGITSPGSGTKDGQSQDQSLFPSVLSFPPATSIDFIEERICSKIQIRQQTNRQTDRPIAMHGRLALPFIGRFWAGGYSDEQGVWGGGRLSRRVSGLEPGMENEAIAG